MAQWGWPDTNFDSPTLSERLSQEQEASARAGEGEYAMEEEEYADDCSNEEMSAEVLMQAQSCTEESDDVGEEDDFMDETLSREEEDDESDCGESDGSVAPSTAASDALGDWMLRRASAGGSRAARPQAARQQRDQQRQHAGAASGTRPLRSADASSMSDYDATHLGANVTPKLPAWDMSSSSSTWQPFAKVMQHIGGLRCVRATVFNLPAELVPSYATRFRQWCTPSQNPGRASQIAALFGMVMSGTSKGFMCAARPRVAARRPA